MIRANYKIPRGMGRGLIQRDMQQSSAGFVGSDVFTSTDCPI
jgi:hypothetical protein